MKIRGKCEGCRVQRWLIRKRVYEHKVAGRITSKGLFCGRCARRMKKMMAI